MLRAVMGISDRQVIALAGVFQAADLVRQVARRGMADTSASEASISSLFKIDADSAADVFGGVAGVAMGLRLLKTHWNREGGRNSETLRYALNLLRLERKASRNLAMMKAIAEGIEAAGRQRDHFPLLHANVLARLASIYSGTISTLSPRIMVKGEPLHLENPENVNRVRALLLSGIRSAVLWRQMGGRGYQLILGGRRIPGIAEKLLHQAATTPTSARSGTG